MTQEELTKLINEFLPYPSEGQHIALRQFAKLVAQDEREACAKIVEESSLPDTYSQECLPEIANDIRARGQA
jgi:hypothetical protein